MFTYAYKVVVENHRIISGTVRAWTSGRASRKAAAFGTVIRVTRKSASVLSRPLNIAIRSFSSMDRIIFFRDMALMMNAGMSPIGALEVLSDQARTGRAKRALAEMRVDVENGLRLSQAMAKHMGMFPELQVETVNVGEVTGELSETLDRIAVDLERDYELTRKVLGALAYPVVIIGVMLVVLVVLVGYVLPQIASFADQLNVTLPLPTRILIAVGLFLQNHWAVPLFGFIGIGFGLYAAIRNDRTRLMIHATLLKIPVYGALIKEFNLARFFRSLESLFTSGISLVRAVTISQKIVTNEAYRQALSTVHPMLSHGMSLMDSLEPYPNLFPLQIQRIVGVGEKTGKIDESFNRIASHYERSLDHKTKTLASLIEPVLIVFVGVIIGGIAVSIFLPIYQATMSVSSM